MKPASNHSQLHHSGSQPIKFHNIYYLAIQINKAQTLIQIDLLVPLVSQEEKREKRKEVFISVFCKKFAKTKHTFAKLILYRYL